MTKEEFISARTRIISNMLDNPDEYGIYPTTKCFNELDALYDELTKPLQITTPTKPIRTAEEILRVVYDKYVKLHPEQNWTAFEKDEDSIKLSVEAMEEYASQFKNRKS